MATTQLPDQQQQQQQSIYPQPASSHSGSVGPFFAVLAVITVLTALSCVLGRFCAARVEGLDSRFDCLEWIRRQHWHCRVNWHCRAVDVENHPKPVDNVEVTDKPQENQQVQPLAA